MRVGIIDLGTNSVRFDVQQYTAKTYATKIYSEKRMVRLGQDLFVTGKLHKEAKKRTLDAFKRFQIQARFYKIDRMVAFATSALREAQDAQEFVELVRKKTGIHIQIISGLKEAQLIAQGVLANDPRATNWNKFALVDIGGGSVEIAICENRKVIHIESFNLGVARLNQMFLNSPLELRAHISDTLNRVIKKNQWGSVKKIMGSSGTIKTLIRMGRKNKNFLSRKAMQTLSKQMSRLSSWELLNLPGMDPNRIDTVTAGGILFHEIMKSLKADKAFFTDFSLRDGIAAAEIKSGKSHEFPRNNLDFDKITEWTNRHLSQQYVDKLAVVKAFFNTFNKSLKLDPVWGPYFCAFCLLSQTGKMVSFENFEKHSAYFVQNCEFLGLLDSEKVFLSELCLLQNKQNKIFNTKNKAILFYLHQLYRVLGGDFFQRCKVVAGSKQWTFRGPHLYDFEKKRVYFERAFNNKISIQLS
jgi:exopolyphosphatase/guanosine-5'-triphosphate,3'-diphosphate pyrophosphatase